MKIIEFIRETLSSDPAWEIDLYRSNDINGTYSSERACLEAVVLDRVLYDPGVTKLMVEIELDRILIENDIYVIFREE